MRSNEPGVVLGKHLPARMDTFSEKIISPGKDVPVSWCTVPEPAIRLLESHNAELTLNPINIDGGARR